MQASHEQEGPQHTHGVAGELALGARRIEGSQHGGRRIEIEVQEPEGGLRPRLGQEAGLAAQPAREWLGQGHAILGIQEGQRRFFRGRKGKTTPDPGVPLTPGSGKAEKEVSTQVATPSITLKYVETIGSVHNGYNGGGCAPLRGGREPGGAHLRIAPL